MGLFGWIYLTGGGITLVVLLIKHARAVAHHGAPADLRVALPLLVVFAALWPAFLLGTGIGRAGRDN